MSLKKLSTFLFTFSSAACLLSVQTGCQTTPAPSNPEYAPDAAAESTPSNDSFFSAPNNDWETDAADEAPVLDPHPPAQAELEPFAQPSQPSENRTASTPIRSSHYTVVKDDTLWRIARRSGTSLDALRLANDLSDTDMIRPGQELIIPSNGPHPSPDFAPSSESTSTYLVERGDTLSEIALRFNTRVADIKAANNLEGDLIRIGQRLELPGSEETTDRLPEPREILEEGETEESPEATDPLEEMDTEENEEEEEAERL